MTEESRSAIEDAINSIYFAPLSSTHIELATKIAERCAGARGLDLTNFMDPRKFSGGEFCPRFSQYLGGKTVYLILIPGPYKSSEELMERAYITAEAAKENGAEKVVLLATDFPHGRQDRGPSEDEKAMGEPNTVRCHARHLEAARVDEVLTIHAHSPRLDAFFALEYGLIPDELLPARAKGLKPREIKVPEHISVGDPRIQKIGRQVFKSISPHAFLADYLLHHSSLAGTKYLENAGAKLVVRAMDEGNRFFADELYDALFLENASQLYCSKLRKKKNDPESVEVDVIANSENFETLEGKLEINADDGIETAGTMFSGIQWSNQGSICAQTGRAYGKPEDRLIYATHAWLGGVSHQLIQERLFKSLPAKEFVLSNSRPYISDSQYYRFKAKSTILRFAGLCADAMLASQLGQDVTTRYSGFESEEEQHEFLKNLYALKRHSWHFLNEGDAAEKREVTFKLRK